MLIDKDVHKSHFIRMELRGLLGMGETAVFVLIDAITMIIDFQSLRSHHPVSKAVQRSARQRDERLMTSTGTGGTLRSE
jgi:hypothetical protein